MVSTTRGRHVDLADPLAGREPPDGPPRLQDLGPVVAAHLLHRPGVVAAGPAGQVDARQAVAQHARASCATARARAAMPAKINRSSRVVEKRLAVAHSTRPSTRSRCRCHISCAIGPAHGVADGDDPVDAELVGQRDARRRRSRAGGTDLRRADAPTVATMVDGDHPEPAPERGERCEPVEVRGRRPAVQEQHGRGPGRSGHLPDERGAPPRAAPRSAPGGRSGVAGATFSSWLGHGGCDQLRS